MKKTLFAAALAAATISLVPAAGVSADSYSSDWSDGDTTSQEMSWSEDDSVYSESGTIVDTLVEDGDFTTLVAAVQAAGLADTLSAPGQLTVFAPTDEAFANLPEGTVEALLQDIPTLTKVLTNHVVAGSVDGETAIDVGEAMALSGNMLNIGYGDDGELYINDARITMTDIETSNGIIHVIDAVLVP